MNFSHTTNQLEKLLESAIRASDKASRDIALAIIVGYVNVVREALSRLPGLPQHVRDQLKALLAVVDSAVKRLSDDVEQKHLEQYAHLGMALASASIAMDLVSTGFQPPRTVL
ncbi:MAG: hypothetical protein QXR64_06785 [Pyrobaculum sp.]